MIITARSAVITVIVFLIVISAIWLLTSVLRVIRPLETKIANVQDGRASVSLVWPESRDGFYCLILAGKRPALGSVPDDDDQLTGAVSVLQAGTVVCRFELSSSVVQSCNWLDEYGLDGWIVKGSDWCQSQKLLPGKTYTITLQLDTGSEHITSLWLSYFEKAG